MNTPIIINTELPAKILNKGKIRDIYEVDHNLLLIATDRISAFDVTKSDSIKRPTSHTTIEILV